MKSWVSDVASGIPSSFEDRASRRRRGSFVLLLATILLVGTVFLVWNRKPAPIIGHADYVALGSSFAAGPGVGARDAGSPYLCARSSTNYPHRLARRLGLSLRDMSCSGATIANVLTDSQAHQPPQIQGIDRNTKLVTVTIGGNDVGYLGNLAGGSCANARSRVPILWRPLVCKSMSRSQVTSAFAVLGARMDQLVQAIRTRAPGARIVLVDYTTVLPDVGACPDIAPLTAGQVRDGNRVAERLRAITRDAARRDAVLYAAASTATAGHDVCSRDPWVFGFVFQSIPLVWGPFAYHPNDKAIEAITGIVLSELVAHPAG